MTVIQIAAAIILDEFGRTLLVRKRGTEAFMQAGGKIEPGETPIDALRRELKEELDIDLTEAPDYLGAFSAPAAELEEIRWVDPRALPPMVLAPLTRDHLLPSLVK